MSGDKSLPASPSPISGLPENATTFDFAGWEGIDTKPSRAGVEDSHAYWLDNIMPLGRNNLRAMQDRGGDLYVAPDGTLITWNTWFALTVTKSCAAVFLSDGSIVQVAKDTAVVTQIAPPGTIHPTDGFPYAFQFGAKYLIIIAEQTNGYWLWDGTNLYGAGTLAPVIDITSGGQGYTSAPTVTFVTGSGGTGVLLHAIVSGGSVTNVIVDNPGSGFVLNENPIILFSGGGGGTSAYGQAGTNDGVITSLTLTSGGGGFTSIPTVTIADSGGGTGSGATAVVTGVSGGILTGIRIVSGGINYLAPVVSFGGPGAGASATATTSNGVVTSVTMIQPGSGYSGNPTPLFVSGTAAAPGTGAAGIAQVDPLTGAINNVIVTQGGNGYTGTLYVIFEGGNGPASATAQIMPFGIQGSTGDVNSTRIWIASIVNPVKVFFSAPGLQAPQDFSVADGAGAFPPTDSHLQYQWTSLKASSGGFLYLVGDSSVDVESGANTTGTPPITTFSILSVDEQIGTVWRDSVINYGRAIIFANTFGIHSIYGGAVTKISAQLDGFYSASPAVFPSSAVAEIFGIHVYMLLKEVVDLSTGNVRRALLLWDGRRWWTGSQRTNLILLSTREFDSSIEAWGTDGHSLFQLFATPSTLISKTMISKLWTKPSIIMQKKALMFYALYETVGNVSLNFYIDTEAPGSALITQSPFVQSSSLPTWARSKTPEVVGYTIGYRLTSSSAQFKIVDLTLLGQEHKLSY